MPQVGCVCGSEYCGGGTSCGCIIPIPPFPFPFFIHHTYNNYLHEKDWDISFKGAIKCNLGESILEEPNSFWQREFEGKQVNEQLSYERFFQKMRAVLCQLGFKKLVDITLDHHEVFNYRQFATFPEDLEEGISSALNELRKDTERSIHHGVDLVAIRRTGSFHEQIRVSYFQKHELRQNGMCVFLEFVPNEALKPERSDSENSYQTRVKGFSETYNALAVSDFLSIYDKMKSIFFFSKEDEHLSLEDYQKKPIPLYPEVRT